MCSFMVIFVLHGKSKFDLQYRVPTVMEKSWKMTGHGKVMEKSWKIIGHGKVMEFSRSWKKSWKTQIWTNLFCLCNTDLTTNNKGLSYETLI